nr:ubiquitin hydrolase [Tanacetum cinerariifolium]
MANEEDHALVADRETPSEFAFMANIENNVFDNSLCSKDCKKNTDSLNSEINELKNELYESNTYRHSYKLGVDQLEGRLAEYREREVKYIEKIRTLEMYKESNLERIKILTNEVETLKEERDVVDGKLARLLKSSKDLENIIESQRSEKVKEGVGYNDVPPPAADLYLSPKKDLSWTGLPEFVDDIVTDYSRPSPTVASTSPKDSQPESKSKEQETPKKSQVKYPEQNKHSNKRPKGNQRNWNNLKSYQLGPEFVLHKKPCFNCGDFSHLANDCRRRVQRETNRSLHLDLLVLDHMGTL